MRFWQICHVSRSDKSAGWRVGLQPPANGGVAGSDYLYVVFYRLQTLWYTSFAPDRQRSG